MSNKLEGSKTWENLKTAFAGECMAHTKYEFYAKKAQKEGYGIIADFFDEASRNENEHAKIWFKMLHNDDVPITKKNLLDSINAEKYENQTMYKNFAETAEKEGFTDIARLFKLIANIEGHHESRYKALLEQLNNDELYKSDDAVFWICTKCGYVHKGKFPPEACPVCKHPSSFFRKASE